MYRILVGTPEENISLESPRPKCEDNIKIDIQEVRCGAWTGFIMLRAGTSECGNELSGLYKMREFLE
jgi:hypothetical protein